MSIKNPTDRQRIQLKKVTYLQRQRAAKLGMVSHPGQLSQFGNLYLISSNSIYIISRDGAIVFSGRTGRSA